MRIDFTETGWADYVYWQTEDKKTLKRINLLIRDIIRDPFNGLGKPEPLKGDLSGFFSRHIDEANRIVYMISEGKLEIYQCKGHYNEK
ncbi:txe/YoeB family addiction module toxin [Clostridia bacterium]|nr:txe/YoeB family addiction module toxin [Clostridia bacterium]